VCKGWIKDLDSRLHQIVEVTLHNVHAFRSSNKSGMDEMFECGELVKEHADIWNYLITCWEALLLIVDGLQHCVKLTKLESQDVDDSQERINIFVCLARVALRDVEDKRESLGDFISAALNDNAYNGDESGKKGFISFTGETHCNLHFSGWFLKSTS
jgi:hypothetical protein